MVLANGGPDVRFDVRCFCVILQVSGSILADVLPFSTANIGTITMPCGTLVTDNLGTSTTYWESYNTAGSKVASGSYPNQAAGGSYLSSTGTCTPGYHKLRRAGKLIPYTPWLQIERSVLNSSAHPSRIKMTANQAGDYFTDWIRGEWGSTVYRAPVRCSDYPPVAAVAADTRYLLNQAAASAYSSHTYDLGTFIGELPETLQMLGKTVQRFRDLKDRKFKKSLSREDAASYLLEARYGWSPLYRDLKSLHKQFLKQQKSINRVVGRSQASGSITESWSDTSGDAARSITYSWSDTISFTGMASVAADYAQSHWKLNPVATGYELIPYSFVVDWFWNLSQAIRASSLVLGASNLTSCGGMRVVNTRTFTLSATAKSGWTYLVDPSGSETSQAICTSRWPMAVPYLPPIQVRLDGNKIADLIAMIAQLKAVKAFYKSI